MIESFLERFRELTKEFPEEIPSFTQIYKGGGLLAEAFNSVEANKTTSLHSEVIAIEKAQSILKDKFLTDTTLITAIEPCLMCSGAILQARIETVIYLAEAEKSQGITSFSPELIYTRNHFPTLKFYHSKEIEAILKGFFRNKR